MENMLSIAKKQGIMVHYHSFKKPIKGIYWAEPGMPPIIGLNRSLRRNTPLLRCVMAEELGHHFTTVGQCIPRQFYHLTARLMISKAEQKALRWAARYLIAGDKLHAVAADGLTQLWELAEYFQVTEDMISFRIRLLQMRKEFHYRDAIYPSCSYYYTGSFKS